jgi:hypothetical protein
LLRADRASLEALGMLEHCSLYGQMQRRGEGMHRKVKREVDLELEVEREGER